MRNSIDRLLSFVQDALLSPLAVPTILFLALFLRILALLDLKKSIYFDFLLWDERLYHMWATQIATGTYTPSAVYEFAPIPAYVLSVIYRTFSPDILYFRIFNLIVGVLTCFVGYEIGKEMAGRIVGTLTCFLMAIYEPFIFYSIVPLTAAFTVFIFSLLGYGILVNVRTPSLLNSFLLGAVSGFAPNVRGNFVILVPLTLWLVFWQQCTLGSSLVKTLQSLLCYLLGFVLIICPIVIRNNRITDTFMWLPSQSGFNLYLGNNLDNTEPYYRPVPFASSSPFEQGVQFTIEASRRVGRFLSPEEASMYWRQEVVQSMLQYPIAFLRKTLQKTLALCNHFEPGDHYHIRFMSQFVPFFQFPFLRFAFVFPFAVAGMVVMGRTSRKLLYMICLSLLYASTLVIFVTNTRYRLPLFVVFIPFAIIGVKCFFDHLRRRQIERVKLYLAIIGACTLLEFLPIRGTDDLTAYYNTHAIILNSKGKEAEAVKYWEQSSQMNKAFSAFANLSLARTYGAKDDYTRALSYLDRISDQSFAAAFKYELFGDMMLKQNQTEKAITAYRQSLAINSGRRKVWRKLVGALRKTDTKGGGEETEMLEYISSFYKGM